MFYSYNGTGFQINCQVVPNTDVSGVGVRWALFLQAFTTIILSALALEPSEILMTNISTQGTSLALIVATFFDPTVDIVHSIITSQFAVLFSICRITSLDIPLSLPPTRTSMKMFSRLQLLDFFFRTCLLSFNIQLWSTILKMQKENLCPTGAGSWSFFFKKFNVSDHSWASTLALAYCIIDIISEFLRHFAVVMEEYISMDQSRTSTRKSWDPRIKLLTALADSFKITQTLGLFALIRPVALLYKLCSLVYVSANILQSINDNGLTGEEYWTFGQIFSIANMVGTLAVLIAHVIPSTVSASPRFIGRYLLLLRVPGFGKLGVPVMVASYIYIQYFLLYGDHNTGFVFALITVGHILGFAVTVILCIALIGPVQQAGLFLLGVIYRRLAPIMTYVLVPLLSSRVARATDRAFRGFEQHVRSIVSSDRISKVIETKELSVLELCIQQGNQWYWTERKANVYEKNGDLILAIDEWVRIATLLTDDWWPHYQIASLYEKLGDFERAISIWEDLVIKSDQENWHSLMIERLEHAYIIGRGPEASIEAWKELVLANPRNRSLFIPVTRILNEHVAYTTSVEIFTRLSEMNSEDEMVKTLLARAYERKRDYNRGCELWRKIWDQFKSEAAEFGLVSCYLLLLTEADWCVKCLLARKELDPGYTCEKCDQYIGGLTNVKVHVSEELSLGLVTMRINDCRRARQRRATQEIA
jgi:tetratricopeptide (TPR) repeat protein